MAAAVIVAAAGCGDGRNGGAAPAGAESAYCDEARDWAIQELDRGQLDETDPAALRAYWGEYMSFAQAATDVAPSEIKEQWTLKFALERDALTPVLEKYEFDVAAIMESGSPEEQALSEAPPEVQVAQDAILGYESEVCGAQQPVAADISFAGEEPGQYCELVAADNQRVAEVMGSGAEPAAVEELADHFVDNQAEVIEAAPDVIKDDVIAVTEWTVGRQRSAFERHDWDVRALLREGSAQDRADLNLADEEIRQQFTRVVAYEEQVCGE